MGGHKGGGEGEPDTRGADGEVPLHLDCPVEGTRALVTSTVCPQSTNCITAHPCTVPTRVVKVEVEV